MRIGTGVFIASSVLIAILIFFLVVYNELSRLRGLADESTARGRNDDAVNEYNKKIRTFPYCIVAVLFGFGKK